jgi:DNA-binding CsgD family transcriptional regulator
MSRDDEVRQAIESIHDAVLLPDGWNEVLARVANAARSEHACLMVHDSGDSALIAAYRMTGDQMCGLARMEEIRDPHWQRVTVIPERATVLGTQFIEDREFQRSVFYNEAIRPIGAFYGLVAKPIKSPEIDSTLSVGRRLGREDFNDVDVTAVRMALPHLATALRNWMTLTKAGRQVRAASHAFDALNVAVAMVDAKGKIAFANGLADALLSRDNSLTENGIHIGGTRAPTLRRLRYAIAQCAADSPRAVAPIDIKNSAGSPSLRVTVSPLGRRTIDLHAPAGAVGPVALVTIHDLEQRRRVMREKLSRRFRLTSAEAGVVMELIQGGGREDVARRLGISVATVRTHLTHIFEKTGVRRQAELMRLAFDTERNLD